MNQIAQAEIERLAREQAEAELRAFRSENAALKRELEETRSHLEALVRSVSTPALTVAPVIVPVKAERKPGTGKNPLPMIQTSVTGAEVRSLRERLGLSLEKFGRLLGMSRNGVSFWEHKVDEPLQMQQA